MEFEILRKIGLANNEASIYLQLLELGSIPAGVLIKRSGLHRTAVYDLLERLIEKGLVNYVFIGNVKHFEAVDPHQLLSYVDEQKEKLNEHSKEIKKIIPGLVLKRKLSKENQEAAVFKGKKAIKTIAEEILRSNSEFLVFGAEGKFKETYPVYYQIFHTRRVRQGMKMKIIYSERLRKYKRGKELKHLEIRYLPDEFETPANTWVFANCVAIIVWGEQPIATLIRSKDVAKAYKTNFDLLWKMAKR